MRGSVQNVRDESGAPDPHVFEIGGFASVALPEPQRQEIEFPIAAAHEIITAAPLAATQPMPPHVAERPLTTRQLLSQLRARLRVVEREIKTRQALESERSQIKRLIAAATIERNNVRAIRDAG